ncbi:hypothetical protein GCM10009745_61550 [Kribbella yunnanensis]|uniref:Uncharacterized protein n=1 Tax=Kribbella yunnanensis TaxID=190194 RepID=A0ABP4UH50_9ACTN
MADEAEEMLEILFKQIRKLVRDLDRFRKVLQQNKQAQMPRSLMEEIRDIRTHNPDIDRSMNDRPSSDQYGRIEQQLQVLRQREADLQRQLDDRQRELEANQDLNRDGIDDTSVDDRDERDEVTDDRDDREETTDDRDEQQEDDRERAEEEREREEREREEREREEREKEEREKAAREKEHERESGTPGVGAPAAALGTEAAGAAAAADYERDSRQMEAEFEADSQQMRDDVEAKREQMQEGFTREDGTVNQEALNGQEVDRGEPEREFTHEDGSVNQEALSGQEPERQQEQDDREFTHEDGSVNQEALHGQEPESRREQETERQEEDREQADVGTGEGFATGGDHAVADRAAEQAEQPDGRVQAEDQLLEQERLDRQNQGGASPEQDGTGRSQMSPEEMQRLQDMNKGLENPNGAVGSRPSGESLDGARGGQTAAQVHAKTTQRGGREQSGHELQKG